LSICRPLEQELNNESYLFPAAAGYFINTAFPGRAGGKQTAGVGFYFAFTGKL